MRIFSTIGFKATEQERTIQPSSAQRAAGSGLESWYVDGVSWTHVGVGIFWIRKFKCIFLINGTLNFESV